MYVGLNIWLSYLGESRFSPWITAWEKHTRSSYSFLKLKKVRFRLNGFRLYHLSLHEILVWHHTSSSRITVVISRGKIDGKARKHTRSKLTVSLKSFHFKSWSFTHAPTHGSNAFQPLVHGDATTTLPGKAVDMRHHSTANEKEAFLNKTAASYKSSG